MKNDSSIAPNATGDQHSAVHYPIYLNASFQASSPEQLEQWFVEKNSFTYSRLQNPNCHALEQRLAKLCSAHGAIVTNTGMSAITGLFLTLAHAGGHIIAAPTLFSGTLNSLRTIMPKFGVSVSFCDLNDLDRVSDLIQSNTCMVFGELMGNPALQILNLPQLSQLCDQQQLPLVLDSTLTPPTMVDFQRWNIAATVQSTTKYIMGNGSLLGGLVLEWGKFDWQLAKDPLLREAVKKFGKSAFLEHYRIIALHTAGITQQPFAAAMHEVQLETLKLRLAQQCANAAQLAAFLAEQPQLERVIYPGLRDNPYHKLADEIFNQYYGNMIAIDLGNKERAFTLLHKLKIPRIMTNLGDLRTLIIHPGSTMYHSCSAAERQLAGVTAGLLRISVGVEEIADLREDFTSALAQL